MVLSERFSKKEEALRDLQRDYKYKLEEVEKLARIEKEKHDTVEVSSSVNSVLFSYFCTFQLYLYFSVISVLLIYFFNFHLFN